MNTKLIPILLLLTLPALGQIHTTTNLGSPGHWYGGPPTLVGVGPNRNVSAGTNYLEVWYAGELILVMETNQSPTMRLRADRLNFKDGTSLTNWVETETFKISTKVVTNQTLMWVYDESSGAHRTNFINQLLVSGEFCRVRGDHDWHQDLSGVVFAMNWGPDGAPSMRKCHLCGIVQTKQPGSWK